MRGSIRKQGKDSWRITVSLGKVGVDPETGKPKYGKYQETFVGKKRDAEKRLVDLIAQLQKGVKINPEKMTFGEFLDRWMQDYVMSNTSQRTIDGYESIIRNHLKPHLGDIPLQKLHPTHLRDLYSKLLKEGRKDGKNGRKGLDPTTILHIHRVIHEALECAVKWELVHRNVADVVDPPKKSKDEEKEVQFLPREKIKDVLDVVKGTYLYIPTCIAVSTGARLGEVLALTWDDVDLKKMTVSIRRSIGLKRKEEYIGLPEDKLPNKGRNEIYFKSTKTRQSKRTIDIPQWLVDELKKHRTQQKKDRLAYGKIYQDNNLVCCREDGSPHHPTTFSSIFSRTVKKAGINVTFHGLRHGHATWLFEEGEHPKAVSERLGHSKTGITLDLYTHHVKGTQKKIARKLDDILA
ncbi:tyrosine-type recombinase/integrase [Desulfofundulus thermobenzoicus]|nr:site-specific integrase [Desulfofundulus thermobenzoicus]